MDSRQTLMNASQPFPKNPRWQPSFWGANNKETGRNVAQTWHLLPKTRVRCSVMMGSDLLRGKYQQKMRLKEPEL